MTTTTETLTTNEDERLVAEGNDRLRGWVGVDGSWRAK